MTDPYPIQPITESEFDAFYLVEQHAFNHGPLDPERRERARRLREYDRTLAAFDDSRIVGTTYSYGFQLSVPGAVIPAAGVSLVGVLPTHRRRGVLRSLMQRQLLDIAQRNEPIAALWASESVLYGRYGYGAASWHATLTLGRGEGTLSPSAPRDPSLRLNLADPRDARSAMEKVYETVLGSRPGLFARSDLWWERLLHDPESERNGRSPLRCLLASDDSVPRGYALYSGLNRWDDTFLPDASIQVLELTATDPAASAALWENLLSRDLVTSIKAPLRPADDPLLFQLTDARRLRRQVADGLWVRLIEVPAALTARAYAAPVDAVLEVRDDLLPANAARWRLTTSSDHVPSGTWSAQCERTSDTPDISVDVRELGAAYLGGTSLGALAAAGLVTEHRPGAVTGLSAAMSWSPSPWCPMIF